MTETVGERPLLAVDADVLIYSVVAHPFSERIRTLFERASLCGSTLLLPEALIKPTRQSPRERDALRDVLGRTQLWPATSIVCNLAVAFGAKYRLPTVDAVHLATAVDGRADAFFTNNRKDFDQDQISEIEILYPSDLPS